MADPAKLLYRDPGYDSQLGRTLAAASVGAADLGESLATARRVGRLNGANWYRAWAETAEVARSTAERARAEGDRVTARRAFLRSSEYYRQAYYFVRAELDGARLQDAYRKHVESFRAATALMDCSVEQVRIPYSDTALAGYLISADRSAHPRPTLIFPCGYDSTSEAGWVNVPPALERGYQVLLFDGPGQGEALYVQRLFLRPDFENVLGPVLDWLFQQPTVDPSRVAIVGRSFAGYLAPRAAAFEHRLAALVCDPAQPDMAQHLPQGLAGRVAPSVVRAQMRTSASRSEFFEARMAAHGVDGINAYFAELRRFNMLGWAAAISCPTLIVESENDFAGGGGQSLKEAMRAPVELVRLTDRQGAGGHCAGLGQEIWAGAVYDWLGRTLGSHPGRGAPASGGATVPG